MAVLAESGRLAAVSTLLEQPLHLAWGTGCPEWDTAPVTPSVDTTALVNEVGRRQATQAAYCRPDPQGEIRVPEGRFALSPEPTNHLFMRFLFDYADAPTATIREIAVFVGAVAKAGVPEGKAYLLPSEIEHPGMLLTVERISPLPRNKFIRHQFEQVVEV
ncbi:MAG: hypothetical protein AB7E55_06725 [Pigmentiphaga sp.]